MNLDRLGRRWEKGLARQQSTSLSRAIDPRMQSNVAALGISVVAGMAALAARLLDDTGILESLTDAFGAGVAVFLAWALGRELDPDNNSSALVAEFAAFALWFWLPASPGLLLATVIAARLMVRSTGRPPSRGDLIFVVLLGTYVATQEAGAAATIGMAATLVVSRSLGGGDHPRSMLAALVTLIAGGAAAAIAGSLGSWYDLDVTASVLLGTGVLSVAILGLKSVASSADYTGEPLDVRRVRVARWFTAVIALGGFALAGGLGVSRMAGAWAALVAVAATKLVRTARI